jgi:tRNA pseudouridine55 synthase
MSRTMCEGVLNLAKPSGITSRAVVDHVCRVLGQKRAGHAGTLDPLASGVLVVCVGVTTRFVSYVQAGSKSYHATFLLGLTSDTDDITGQVALWNDPAVLLSREAATSAPDQIPPPDAAGWPTLACVTEALAGMQGEIEQVPPAFSAIKVFGRRAYKLARKGRDVDLEPRRVRVDAITLLEYRPPVVRLAIDCGSGTYIRSIGRDLGAALGCGAVMSELVRTRVGTFDLAQALRFEELSQDSARRALQPTATAVMEMPRRLATSADLEQLACGRPLPAEQDVTPWPDGSEIALLDEAGALVALGRWNQARGLILPSLVLSHIAAPNRPPLRRDPPPPNPPRL